MKKILEDYFNCFDLHDILILDNVYKDVINSKGCFGNSCMSCPIYNIQDSCTFYENPNQDRLIEWEDYVNDRKLKILVTKC